MGPGILACHVLALTMVVTLACRMLGCLPRIAIVCLQENLQEKLAAHRSDLEREVESRATSLQQDIRNRDQKMTQELAKEAAHVEAALGRQSDAVFQELSKSDERLTERLHTASDTMQQKLDIAIAAVTANTKARLEQHTSEVANKVLQLLVNAVQRGWNQSFPYVCYDSPDSRTRPEGAMLQAIAQSPAIEIHARIPAPAFQGGDLPLPLASEDIQASGSECAGVDFSGDSGDEQAELDKQKTGPLGELDTSTIVADGSPSAPCDEGNAMVQDDMEVETAQCPCSELPPLPPLIRLQFGTGREAASSHNVMRCRSRTPLKRKRTKTNECDSTNFGIEGNPKALVIEMQVSQNGGAGSVRGEDDAEGSRKRCQSAMLREKLPLEREDFEPKHGSIDKTNVPSASIPNSHKRLCTSGNANSDPDQNRMSGRILGWESGSMTTRFYANHSHAAGCKHAW